MGDSWVPLATAAGILGWPVPPSPEQMKQFGERLRDGLIGYKPVREHEGSLVFHAPPPLDFDRSTAEARAPVDSVWAMERRKFKTVNIPILVRRADIVAQTASLRGASVRMSSNVRAENACAAWISSLPAIPAKTHAQALDEAQKKFGAKLSKRAFRRAWDMSAPAEWRRAGKRSANRSA